MNDKDKFENVVEETFTSGTTIDTQSICEQRALADFFKLHPNIAVYFHGHVHLNQFYTWLGPDNTISLPVVSVDSPAYHYQGSFLEFKPGRSVSFLRRL
jgi:hypothetical protein